jgi:hypothetical protein
MSATPTGPALKVELLDIARFVKEGRRRRVEETDKLFHAIGRGTVRMLRAVAALPGHSPEQPGQSAA